MEREEEPMEVGWVTASSAMVAVCLAAVSRAAVKDMEVVWLEVVEKEAVG